MSTITLKQPIERRSAKTGEVVDRLGTLTFRPLKLGDLVAAMDAAGPKPGPGTLTLNLAARCCGLSPRELEDLGIEDGLEVMEAIQGFIPAGLRTGTNGLPSSPAPSASPPTGGTGGQPSSASGATAPDGGSAA